MRREEAPPLAVMSLVQLALLAAKEPWVSAHRLERDLLAHVMPWGRVAAALRTLETSGIVRSRRGKDGQEEWALVDASPR
jgi:DNA-binding IscR family transcriptional regulator